MLSGDFTDLGQWAYNFRRNTSLSPMSVAMDCASYATDARLERIRREAPDTLLATTIDFPFPEICDGTKFARLGDEFRKPIRAELPILFITGEMDGRTPISNVEEVAAGFPNHQHLVVANAAHGIMGYPELNPLMLAFLRGERITQLRASFPKWDLKHPAQR